LARILAKRRCPVPGAGAAPVPPAALLLAEAVGQGLAGRSWPDGPLGQSLWPPGILNF